MKITLFPFNMSSHLRMPYLAIKHEFNPIFHKLTLIDNDPLPHDSRLKAIDSCPNEPFFHNHSNESLYGDGSCEEDIMILDHDVAPHSPLFNDYPNEQYFLDEPRDLGDEGLPFDVHIEGIIGYLFSNTSLIER